MNVKKIKYHITTELCEHAQKGAISLFMCAHCILLWSSIRRSPFFLLWHTTLIQKNKHICVQNPNSSSVLNGQYLHGHVWKLLIWFWWSGFTKMLKLHCGSRNYDDRLTKNKKLCFQSIQWMHTLVVASCMPNICTSIVNTNKFFYCPQ